MIDEWNGLAVLLADMIEKYAGELELDALPDPMFPEEKAAKHNTSKNVYKENVETQKAELPRLRLCWISISLRWSRCTAP